MRSLCSIIIALCSLSVFGNDLSTTIEELCRKLPQGTYTLTISKDQFSYLDNDETRMLYSLNFSSEASGLSTNNNRNNNQNIDYLCLLDFPDNKINNLLVTQKVINEYKFETEQIISGHIEGGSKKLNQFCLKILIPSIGKVYETEVTGRHFKLSGLEFIDGTVFNLQVLKKNGKDGSLSLHVDEPEFPKISVKKHHHSQRCNNKTPEYFKEKARLADLIDAINLPEIIVKERRVKPMNFRHMDPDRTIAENDPIFENAPTLELVVSRIGLKKGMSQIEGAGYIETIGRLYRGVHVPCEIMLDEHLLSGAELSDILNIAPKTIKQIEYFVPSNYEMFGNLAGVGGTNPLKGVFGNASARGLLMIWTKSPTDFSRFRLNRPSSLATIKPLGYTAPMEFNFSKYSSNPTLYWNPKFSPSSPMDPRLDLLETSGNIVVRIEGISDNGDIINRRKKLKL
ncbi:MAG: hypothetical protein NC339_03545 [Muribaculaceae bacterium]|nr:hypothetical protein [Muribaculaceae bacterium]